MRHRLHPDPMTSGSKTRRTLAFFGAGIREPIVRALWPGLLDAAQAYDVKLASLYITRAVGGRQSALSPDILNLIPIIKSIYLLTLCPHLLNM